jgi:hypothetical protein
MNISIAFERLNETEYPLFERFYDSPKEKNISEEDFDRGKKLFDYFKCKIFKEYMKLYLTCDVLILADVFEAFRDMSMKHYGLDPAHYISSPGLSQDAMLKYTKVEPELLTDPDMLYMILEGIRGGLSGIMTRYMEANNKYMINYDPKKESSYLVPVDANNLYGDAMSFSLPYNKYKWCNKEELDYLSKNLLEIPDDNSIGYHIRCDINYPKELHNSHNDYPFFPEHKVITKKYLSPYQKRLTNKNLGSVSKTRKLVANLEDKHKIVVDYRALKQAIQHGLILKNIHCAIKFNQKAWLKP